LNFFRTASPQAAQKTKDIPLPPNENSCNPQFSHVIDLLSWIYAVLRKIRGTADKLTAEKINRRISSRIIMIYCSR